MALLDKDGYPTEETLNRIRTWPPQDSFKALLAFIQSIWTGYWDEEETSPGVHLYRISTVGWSGNEDIISALQANILFWAFCWLSHRRGGHYEFELKKLKT